jgi:hypothetical protein
VVPLFLMSVMRLAEVLLTCLMTHYRATHAARSRTPGRLQQPWQRWLGVTAAVEDRLHHARRHQCQAQHDAKVPALDLPAVIISVKVAYRPSSGMRRYRDVPARTFAVIKSIHMMIGATPSATCVVTVFRPAGAGWTVVPGR